MLSWSFRVKDESVIHSNGILYKLKHKQALLQARKREREKYKQNVQKKVYEWLFRLNGYHQNLQHVEIPSNAYQIPNHTHNMCCVIISLSSDRSFDIFRTFFPIQLPLFPFSFLWYVRYRYRFYFTFFFVVVVVHFIFRNDYIFLPQICCIVTSLK